MKKQNTTKACKDELEQKTLQGSNRCALKLQMWLCKLLLSTGVLKRKEPPPLIGTFAHLPVSFGKLLFLRNKQHPRFS